LKYIHLFFWLFYGGQLWQNILEKKSANLFLGGTPKTMLANLKAIFKLFAR